MVERDETPIVRKGQAKSLPVRFFSWKTSEALKRGGRKRGRLAPVHRTLSLGGEHPVRQGNILSIIRCISGGESFMASCMLD